MAMAATVELDRRSVDDIFRQIRRAERKLGKSNFASMQWAARLIAQSLGAGTKRARKWRKIARNPDKSWRTDNRKTPFGVWGGKGDRFIPVWPKGTSKRFFYNQQRNAWFERLSGGEWIQIQKGPRISPTRVQPELRTSPQRRISRRGLAKLAWKRARSLVGRGGVASGKRVQNIARVTLDRSKLDPSIILEDNLRYAADAFRTGPGAVNTALENAARKLAKRIDQNIEKAMK